MNEIEPIITPKALSAQLPVTKKTEQFIARSRQTIASIIQGKDPRLLIIAGPCSIHDHSAAIDYAQRLAELRQTLNQSLELIMRVYFEKPRTTIAWKGSINDPYLDGSHRIHEGLQLARTLLLEINKLELPIATEFLDPFTPCYMADLISWTAIGARTTESPLHRNLASSLPMPVGFKNTPSGNIKASVEAIYTAQHPHDFLSITDEGTLGILSTQGNPNCHPILRGSHQNGPNYSPHDIQQTSKLLNAHNIHTKILIDCSHGNTNKDYTQQQTVVDQIITEFPTYKNTLAGLMLESNLVAGKQTLSEKKQLTYGQSITDGCIGWEETNDLLTKLAAFYCPKSTL